MNIYDVDAEGFVPWFFEEAWKKQARKSQACKQNVFFSLIPWETCNECVEESSNLVQHAYEILRVAQSHVERTNQTLLHASVISSYHSLSTQKHILIQ